MCMDIKTRGDRPRAHCPGHLFLDNGPPVKKIFQPTPGSGSQTAHSQKQIFHMIQTYTICIMYVHIYENMHPPVPHPFIPRSNGGSCPRSPRGLRLVPAAHSRRGGILAKGTEACLVVPRRCLGIPLRVSAMAAAPPGLPLELQARAALRWHAAAGAGPAADPGAAHSTAFSVKVRLAA